MQLVGGQCWGELKNPLGLFGLKAEGYPAFPGEKLNSPDDDLC